MTGYKLEQSLNGVDFLQIAGLSAAQTSLPVTGLLAQTTYSFRVRATNGSGDSPYSAIATITTPFFGARVNFQDTNTYVLPAAFVADGGMVFGDRTNTYTYGWDVDNTANGRRRANAAITNILLDSFTHMRNCIPPECGRLRSLTARIGSIWRQGTRMAPGLCLTWIVCHGSMWKES